MNPIFENLKICGYRGFRQMELSQLGQVNIFVGANNSGKTSLLEAISIPCNPFDPFQWLEVAQRKSYLRRLPSVYPNLEAMRWIFNQSTDFSDNDAYESEILIEAGKGTHIETLKAKLGEIYSADLGESNEEKFDNDPTSPEADTVTLLGIELNVEVNSTLERIDLFPRDLKHINPEHERKFQFWERERFIQHERTKPIVRCAAIFPTYCSSESILDRLTQATLRDKDNEVLNLVQQFDRNVLDMRILSTSMRRAALYIEYEGIGFAPLPVFGDGLKRALLIALTILNITDGILLIDEIETSLHVSILSKVFTWLIEICRRRNIQLFLTTHSLEAIDAMLQPDIAIDRIVAFRLHSMGQPAQRFSGDLLYRLRSERGLDVR